MRKKAQDENYEDVTEVINKKNKTKLYTNRIDFDLFFFFFFAFIK